MARVLCLRFPDWSTKPVADQAALERQVALERLAECCERFSPVVGWRTLAAGAVDGVSPGGSAEDAWWAGGRLLLEVTGIGRLFGGERALLDEVLAECGRRGYVAHAAIADTIGLAWGVMVEWAGAAEKCGARIVEPAEGGAVLAGLPVAALRISAETVDTLRQLGVLRVEQLERLPRASLAARFGPELLLRLDQARGAAGEWIQPYRPPPQFEAEWRLEEPTENERALGEILRSLLERIAADLAPRNRGVTQLVVRLDVAHGPPRLVRLDLFRPSGSPRHWEELVRLRWERLDEGGPVGRVTVQATLTAPLEKRQQELFAGGVAESPREWGGLIERLTSRLGEEAVLAVEPRREGLPEHDFRYRPWIRRSREPKTPRPAAAVRATCYRPLLVEPVPRCLAVVAVAPDGPPGSFRWQGVWRRVSRWWGPERVELGWWRGPSVRRDYYRLETTTGDRWWLFRDLTSGQWYLHGSFD